MRFICLQNLISYFSSLPLVLFLTYFSFYTFEYRYRLAEDPLLRKAIGESPLMGISLALEQSGRIRVGDVVYVGQL